MLHLHNLLRWVVLILLLISIVKAYTGWQKKKTFTDGDRRIWLFTLISAHTTFLVGLYLVIWGRLGWLKVTLPEGESVMSNKYYRFFLVEHPLFMLVAIVLITLGYGMAKKPIPDQNKFKRAFWLFLVALLMILVAIPWPFREVIGVGRGWIPGM